MTLLSSHCLLRAERPARLLHLLHEGERARQANKRASEQRKQHAIKQGGRCWALASLERPRLELRGVHRLQDQRLLRAINSREAVVQADQEQSIINERDIGCDSHASKKDEQHFQVIALNCSVERPC